MRLETSREAGEAIDANDMRIGDVAVIVESRTAYRELGPGAVIARGCNEFVILGREEFEVRWAGIRDVRDLGVRVRALRPGEQVVITERS